MVVYQVSDSITRREYVAGSAKTYAFGVPSNAPFCVCSYSYSQGFFDEASQKCPISLLKSSVTYTSLPV